MNTDGTAITDIAAYRIYYGASPANLGQFVVASGAGTTSHVINGLTPGTYYFAVATVNSVGVASALSSVVSTTVQ